MAGVSRKRTGCGGVVTAVEETEVNPKRKIPIEASKPQKRGRGEDSAPVVPRAFEVPLQSDCPEWVEKAVLLLTAEDLGSDWRGLIIAWLKFEEGFEFVKSGPSLPTSHRPTAVSSWIQRTRRPNFRPDLDNLRAFEDSFWSWWKTLQPEWRSDDDSGMLKRPKGGDWDVLRISGQNGLLSVIAALCFWGMAAAGSSADVERWSAAVTDVHYALCQLIA